MDSMYFEKLGLNRPPFEETTNAAFFSASPACKMVLEAVKDQVGKGGMSLIKGDSGCGKSILSQAMVGELKTHARILSLSVPPSSVDADSQSDVGSDIGGSSSRGIEQVAGEIVDVIASASDKKCAVIVDQAQHLSADDLIAFQQHITSASKRGLNLAVVLIANEGIERTLRLPELKLITQSINRLGELTSLNIQETEEYIADRLNAGGAKGSKIFARKAVRRIAELSSGVPRKINDLAKRALHIAAERNQSRITVSIIAECAATSNQSDRAKNETQEASMPIPKMESGKVERLVKQLQTALESVPAVVGSRPENAGVEADIVDVLADLAESTGEADARATKLDGAIQRAEATHNRLVDLAEALSRVGTSTDERIELLLTSLESAQQIHEELQLIGDQAQALIGESRNSVADEHDNMLAQLEELTARREELSMVIDQFKNEQEAMLRDAQRDVGEKVDAIRGELKDTSAESKRALEDAKHILQRSERNLKEGTVLGDKVERTLGDAQQLESKLARSFAQIRQDLSEHRENASAATTAHEECSKATQEARGAAEHAATTVTQLAQIESQARTQHEALEQAVSDANSIADQISKRSKEARKEVDDRHEIIQEEIRQAGNGIQERLAAGVAEVGRLTDAAQETINGVTYTIDEQQRDAVNAIQSSQDEAEKSIQLAGREIEARIADSMKRLEQTIATEEGASKRAKEASEHAVAMMTRVSQSEARLAETQQSIINIEALAAETLASVQARLKKMQDTVDVLVDKGATRVQAVMNESLASFQDEALSISDSLRKSNTDMQDEVQTHVREIQASAEAQQRAAQETIEQVAAAIDELAMGSMTDARETVGLVALEASASIEQQKIDLTKEIEMHAANCDVRMTELAQNRTDQIGQQIQSQASIAMTAIQKVVAESSGQIKTVSQEIDKKSHAALVSLEDTAMTSSERAEKRVNNAAVSAANAIQDKIASATETVRNLDEAIVNGNDMVADADERREKINQLIQEVWSLTNTTDHRARSLESLSTKAKSCEEHIGSLVDQAATRMTLLEQQNEAAGQHETTLSLQREQIESISDEVGNQISQGKMLHAELSEANTAGQQIESSLAAHAEEIQGLVATAESIVNSIRVDDERAAQISANVEHSAGVAENVELRLSELQQSLADPISTIQNARAQADELNELCLAVKRIFRGVSQASLDANERIKMMGKMLTATHKTAETMKQWVAEAEHSRERLEAAIRSTPSINDTHPPTMMPDSPTLTDSIPKPVGANDLATVTKIAQSSVPAPSKPASKSKPKPQTKTVKFAGPEATAAEDRIEPAAMVKRTNQMSVAPNGKTPQSPDGPDANMPAKRNRLSPEDVRSLIEAAKNKSAAVG